MPDRARSAVAIVSVRDLSYGVDGHPILSDVSFEVFAGEVFGIMGMSGSGKSTLLRCLMGLVPVTSGQVEIDGEPLTGKSEDQLNRVRMKMGMCFQQAALFDSMTVAENVSFGLKRHARLSRQEIAGRVQEHLEAIGLADFAHYMPADLSGGMKKRVGIARALAVQPAIMLYDEPTSGLDPIIGGQINSLIVQLGQRFGTTSIVVTHEVERLFAIADRVLMIHDRTVAAIDTPEHLRRSDNERVREFIAADVTGLAEGCPPTPPGVVVE